MPKRTSKTASRPICSRASRSRILRRSVAAANGALGISLLEYQQGTRDYTSVLTSEQNLLTAENDLAIAEGSVPLGVTAVYQALGGGWQNPGGQ